MTLAALQLRVARAATDPTARGSGLEDLHPDDLAWLAEVVALDRLHEISAHAPWTLSALADGARVAREFSAARPSREGTALREASAFLRWLRPRAVAQRARPWLRDAIEYELSVVRLQILPPPRHAPSALPERPALAEGVAALELAHDLSPLAEASGSAPAARATGYVLARSERTRSVTVWRVPAWGAGALLLAEGRLDVRELGARLPAAPPADDLARFLEAAAARGLFASA